MPASFEATTTAAAPGAPNIMVFVVDDLGFGDASFMAEDEASSDMVSATPTLSALAKSGIVLSSFYTR